MVSSTIFGRPAVRLVAGAAEERLKFLATVVALRRLARCLCDRRVVFGHIRAVVRELVSQLSRFRACLSVLIALT